MSVIRIVSSTMGQSSPASVRDDAGDGDAGYYRWRKMPGWVPNDPRCRKGAEQPAEPHPGNATRTAGRAARLEEFAGYLGQGLTAQQAGKLMGISLSTARQYKRDLEEQQRGAAP